MVRIKEIMDWIDCSPEDKVKIWDIIESITERWVSFINRDYMSSKFFIGELHWMDRNYQNKIFLEKIYHSL